MRARATRIPRIFCGIFYLALRFVWVPSLHSSPASHSCIVCVPAPLSQLRTPSVQLDALDPASPLAILQPAAPLRHGTRYIVAVNGVLGDWGELLPPTPGFQELVDVRIELERDRDS